MSRLVLNGLDLNNKQITGLADGSAATDAVTKQQLDAALRGLDWKQEVLAASTANVNLASPGTTLDGVTLVNPSRILLKDQSTASQNGIYVWIAGGSALTRALDADSGPELSGATVTVQQGTVNADRVYRVTTDDAITVDTTSIALAQVGGGGGAYTAGNGLTLSTNDFNVGAGTGISVGADTVGIDTAVVTRKFAAACVVTTNPQTFNHGLNNADVSVEVKRVSDGVIVDADVTVTDANNISVNFGGAPTAAQYRVRVDA